MRQTLRFVAMLVFGLGLLTYGAYAVLLRTTRNWFETDLALRARLAVGAARPGFVYLLARQGLDDVRTQLREHLVDLTRDERIMAAEVCGSDWTSLAATDAFPGEFSCSFINRQVEATEARGPTRLPWTASAELPGGAVHASALPIIDGERTVGHVVLVHDLSFIERREAKTRELVLWAFGVLTIGAALFTLVAIRLSWRSFRSGLRRALKGGDEQRPEYRLLIRDVRELVQELAAEPDPEGRGIRWTGERLRAVLRQNLHGERVVVMANREPYIHEKREDGKIDVVHPASGLVTALEPVLRACSGVWVAHGSGSADRETVDSHSRVKVPPGEESYVLRRVWLSPEEEQGYYYGFSNEGLWPLCHLAHARPRFGAEDWAHYKAVNEKFAKAVCDEVDSEDPIIFVQDYHFALAPRLIRERLPHATILTFWHIPWPNAERFGICPWRNELIEGLLGSSIIGFHTQQHCNNFLDGVDAYVESRIDHEKSAVVQRKRRTLVRPYPISIEWPVRWLDSIPSVQECRDSVFAELGLKPDALLGVGIDRLDYTKGVEERLLSVERLLERYPEFRGRFSFAQLAAPSRTKIALYRDLNEAVEGLAARINKRFGTENYRPIILLREHHQPAAVFRYYRAANLCYVSSLHDGMNLVAKEFVAARSDEQGVLVLSRFTGAARELTEALVVNPYDLEEASEALAEGLRMSPEEQRERMRPMRSLVAEFNVYRWAGRMLVDAAQLRRKERLKGRLARQSNPSMAAS